MCEPTTIMLAITAATTALSVAQQKKTADGQAVANERTRKLAVQTMNENVEQGELQKQQLAKQAGDKLLQNNLEAQKALSTSKVQAGANGVAGVSVDSLLANLEGKQLRYNDSVTANLADDMNSVDIQERNAGRQAQSTINQLRTPQQPDYLGAALKIGGAAYGAYGGGADAGSTYSYNDDASGAKYSATGADVRGRR